MRKLRNVESPKDRVSLAHDAGLGRVSFVSVVAGVLGAYGGVALLLAVAGAIASAVGLDTDFTRQEWQQVGVGGAIVLGLVLFLSYLFGGYVAGRMARRAGLANGLTVFVLGIVLIVAAGAVASVLADTDEFVDRLGELGVPTTGDQWAEIGTIAGIATLVAMLAGSLLGGRLGERWHAKLVARAMDPTIGPGQHTPAGSAATGRTTADDTVDLRGDRTGDQRDDEAGADRAGARSDQAATGVITPGAAPRSSDAERDRRR